MPAKEPNADACDIRWGYNETPPRHGPLLFELEGCPLIVTPSLREIDAIAGRRSGKVRSPVMARKLGVHPRTIRRCYLRGGLPGAREHGPRILEVPVHLVRLAEAYGLHGVEQLAKAGLITELRNTPNEPVKTP